MRFSQRIGKTPIKTVLQLDEIDNDLKNGLWNVLVTSFFRKIKSQDNYTDNGIHSMSRLDISRYIWTEFFKETVDTAPYDFTEECRDWFFDQTEWYEIYDFIEFITEFDYNYKGQYTETHELKNNLNSALERELSGYRIIDNVVTPITDDVELLSIEELLNNALQFNSVNTHIHSAIEYFSDKKNPNYRNSIKESISAVEAMCRIILDDNNITLGKALSKIESKFKIHDAMKKAFSALYGFTSDSGGIRHSMTEKEDINITFNDAKFMLVACTAFTNYLIAKYAKL